MPHEGDQQGTVTIPSGLFSAFRIPPFIPYYGEAKTAVTVDVLEAGLITAICVLAVCFILVLPGIPGKWEKLSSGIRIFYSLSILAVIMLCNFGQEWEYAGLHTPTPYKAGTGREIDATIEMKIGLRSINITLKGNPENQLGEKINYNERFSWEGSQGRLGFGPNSGQFNREYRQAQNEGKPIPILWIAEYFTFDGEGIRFGRFYRLAGWYTHIALWTAFPVWMITIILSFMLVRYTAYMMILTGALMLLSNILFASIRNSIPLAVPFENGVLEPHYGWCFWLCMVGGILTTVLGIVVAIIDHFFAFHAAKFFGVDPLQDFDEVYVDASQILKKRGTYKRSVRDPAPSSTNGPSTSGAVPMTPMGADGGASSGPSDHDYDNADEWYQNVDPPHSNKNGTGAKRPLPQNRDSSSDEDDTTSTQQVRVALYKKRGVSRIQRKTFKAGKAPAPLPRGQHNQLDEDDEEDYENAEIARSNARAKDIHLRVL